MKAKKIVCNTMDVISNDFLERILGNQEVQRLKVQAADFKKQYDFGFNSGYFIFRNPGGIRVSERFKEAKT